MKHGDKLNQVIVRVEILNRIQWGFGIRTYQIPDNGPRMRVDFINEK
jgi:hypothetical protein